MNAFANRMRKTRVELEITLRRISEETGKSIAFLSDVEHGRRLPPADDIIGKIEKILLIEDGALKTLARSVRNTSKDFSELIRTRPAIASLAEALMRIENDLGEEQMERVVREMRDNISKIE